MTDDERGVLLERVTENIIDDEPTAAIEAIADAFGIDLADLA